VHFLVHIQAFLSAFEQRCQAAVQAQDVLSAEPWEWELVKLLASSGDLSLSKNKSLLSVAAKARRFACTLYAA
jgi:hypothetical protein